MVKTIFPSIIVILFAFVAGFPLLHKGFPPTHDGEYHVIRFYEFDKTLKSGSWYPRWAADLNHGYGLPLFNYVYPLPNYVSSVLHFFGISFIDAFKLNMFFALIIGSFFFYLFAKEFWGHLGGIVSSIFYTFSPYHFVDVYVRGSVGEVWALAFFPAFLWSITKVFKTNNNTYAVLSAIFLALIIFSHNILALMFFFFAICYVSFSIVQSSNKKHLLLGSVYIIILGLSLSAIFWLPALWERNYVEGLQIFDIKSNFAQVYQLLIPSWGSGFSGAGLQDQMSFQIGIANLFATAAGIFVLFFSKRKDDLSQIIIFFLTWFVIVFFLMLKVSYPLWKSIPLMNYFQFPWRFLSLEILICSFLAGSIVNLKHSKFFSFFLIMVSVVLSIGYTRPAYYHMRNDHYYTTRPNFIEGTNSPGDTFQIIGFNKSLAKAKEKVQLVKGNAEIQQVHSKATNYQFSVQTFEKSQLQANIAYFAGWEVFANGKKLVNKKDKNGLISFRLPTGKFRVEIKFADTFTRRIATSCSVITFFIISSFLITTAYAKMKR